MFAVSKPNNRSKCSGSDLMILQDTFTFRSIKMANIVKIENLNVSDSPFRKWQRPDLPSKCTFHQAKSMEESPHIHAEV